MTVRSSKRTTLARPDTAIVIDGFLRSGNTFSVAAFEVSNGLSLHVGRHLHGAPHILRAVRLGLPTIVLIRQPADAVASYLIRRPTLTPDDGLIEYLDFYSTAWRVREGYVVGLFDTVISDFGAIIASANRRFGTSFAQYVATEANQARVFARVEEMNRLECRGEVVETHVGRPSPSRERSKESLRTLFERPRTAARLRRANAVYERYAALASAQSVPTSER